MKDLGHLCVVMLFLLATSGFPVVRNLFSGASRELLFGLFIGLSTVCLGYRVTTGAFRHERLAVILVVGVTALATFLYISIGASIADLNYLVAVIAAYLLFRTVPLSKVQNYFIAFLLVNVMIMAWEHSVQRYFFVYYDEASGLLLDEKLFSHGVFRAKGMFLGPLSASAFAATCAALCWKRTYVVALCFSVAALAAVRSGLIVTFGILAVSVAYRGSLHWKRLDNRLVALAGVAAALVLVITLVLFRYGNTDYVNRITEAVDITSSTNQARLLYWSLAVDFFKSYDSLAYSLFGDPGAFRNAIGNSTEMQYLQLLVDHGLLGLLFYLVFPAIIVMTAKPNRIYHLGVWGMLHIGFSAVALTSAVPPGVNYWLFLFGLAARPIMFGDKQIANQSRCVVGT